MTVDRDFGGHGSALRARLGMGSHYPGLLGRCLSVPAIDDGISPDRMAVVLAGSIGTALSTKAAYPWLGTGLGWVGDPLRRTDLLHLPMLPFAAVMMVRLRRLRMPT